MTLSLFTQRVLYSNNGTLSDLSTSLNDYLANSVTIADFVAADDYIFIGSALPFNQKYFEIGSTVNAQASTLTIELWNGASWVSAVDVLDRTASSGASLAQNGYVHFRPDVDNSVWLRERRSEDVTGLTGTEIYNMYWARLSWSADWTASVVLDHVGHKFNTDSELYAQYPMLNNADLRAAFNSGTDPGNWQAQTYVAAECIIADLTERGIITSPDQILDATKLKLASIHKTAVVCMGNAFGRAYADEKAEAMRAYTKAINQKNFYVDLNKTADLEPAERTKSTTVLHR